VTDESQEEAIMERFKAFGRDDTYDLITLLNVREPSTHKRECINAKHMIQLHYLNCKRYLWLFSDIMVYLTIYRQMI
jgi:hypothetical protein